MFMSKCEPALRQHLLQELELTKKISFRPRTHYVGETESAALFLWLGPQSTLVRHENAAFRKRSINRRNLKTPAFRFLVDRKHFENGAFSKTMPSR